MMKTENLYAIGFAVYSTNERGGVLNYSDGYMNCFGMKEW
jgi:hypothetical protein